METKTIFTYGLSEFQMIRQEWDFLFSVTDDAAPHGESGCLVGATEDLYPDSELVVIMVLDIDNQPVASIPLMKRNAFWKPVFELPNNEWGHWGPLLVNPAFDCKDVYQAIADGLASLNSREIRLNQIENTNKKWNQLICCLADVKRNVIVRPSFSVGIVEHDSNWQTFKSRLSKGLRKKLGKYRRVIEQYGQVEVEIHDRLRPDQVAVLLDRICNVEGKSWKEKSQTSIKAQKKYDFFKQQARFLAESDLLLVSFLKVDGNDVAFDFGVTKGATYYSHKIGFDANFAHCAPGHLLAESLTEFFHKTESCTRQDTFGPLTEANARWSSTTKTINNITVSGRYFGGRIVNRLFGFLKHLKGGRGNADNFRLGLKPVDSVSSSISDSQSASIGQRHSLTQTEAVHEW